MSSMVNGVIVKVYKCWWIKINTKAVRKSSSDGALFPYIITVKYNMNGEERVKRKWVYNGNIRPKIGDTVKIKVK